MDEDLLVLLEPGVDRLPVEPHRPGMSTGDRRPCRPRSLPLAGLQGVPPGRAERAVLLDPLVHQHAGGDVVHRHVVLGIARPFPDVAGPLRVQDERGADERPDPAGHRRGVAGGGEARRVVAHRRLRSRDGPRASSLPPVVWIAALALAAAASFLVTVWTGPQVSRLVGLGAVLGTALVLLVIWAQTSGHLVAGAAPSLRVLTGLHSPRDAVPNCLTWGPGAKWVL